MADKTADKNSPEKVIEPEETKSNKGEKRSFQTGSDPGQRELLTKTEAEKKGFYWKED